MTTLPSKPMNARRRGLPDWATAPESLTTLLLVIAFISCAVAVPRFLDAAYLLDRSSLYVEIGIMALAMTFVIVGGHIDLSCASILALVATLAAVAHGRWGVPLGVALAMAPLLGAGLGLVNGWLIGGLRLPSLVVTLATMAVYRGLAQVLIGDHSQPLPPDATGIDLYHVGGVPVPLLAMVILAVAAALVLHRTIFGRWVLAMGTNAQAARYSGVPVTGATVALFVISGTLSGLAGLIMASRLGVARYDHALGMELDVITAVVLGGASIFGGRGTIFGTVTALALIATLQTAMGVMSIKAEYQQTANGLLLIIAVLLSNLVLRLRGGQRTEP
jgi:rhamnose transport system permease protein